MPDNNTKTCTGDCLRCSMQQRIYCSAQMTRNLFDKFDAFSERLKAIEERMTRDANSDVFNPMDDNIIDDATEQVKQFEAQ